MKFTGMFRAYVLFTVLIQAMGLSLVGPVIPKLVEKISEADAAGVSRIYGWSIAIGSVTMFLFAPFMGRLCDRFGRRPIVLLSLAGSVIDAVVTATTPHLWVFLLMRGIAGVLGAGGAAVQAAIADTTPPDERAKNFAAVGAAFSSGFIIGPSVGGLVGQLGPGLTFWAAASLYALDFVVGCLLFKETLPPSERRPLVLDNFNPLKAVLGMGRLRLGALFMMFVILIVGVSFADPVAILFMQMHLGWNTAQIGVFSSVCGIAMVAARLILTPVAVKRLGERRTILVGMLCMFASATMYQFIAHGWQMYVMLVFLMMGSVTIPTLIASLSREVPASDQGELQGTLMGVQSAAGIIGPPVGTAIFAYFISPSAPFMWPGAPFMVAMVFILGAFITMLRLPRVTTSSVPVS